MQALQLQRTGRLEQVSLSVPSPAAEELLVRTAVSTICASDLGDIRDNPFGIPLPRVLGHEASGVIAELGAEVEGLAVGDRVAVHPVIPCRTCVECQRGLAHLCSRLGHLGADRDGTFAEYFCVPADRVRRIPATLDLAHAALLEPVAVSLEAINRAGVEPGTTVFVAGDGPFGLMIARLAAGRGVRTIVSGRSRFRLSRAGGDVSLNVDESGDPSGTIMSATNGQGVDAAVLAVDSQEALDLCIKSLRPRGRLAVFAVMPVRPNVDMLRLLVKEIEIVGACNDEDLLDEALSVIMDNALRLDELVTHRIAWDDWRSAFEIAEHRTEEALKVALVFPPA